MQNTLTREITQNTRSFLQSERNLSLYIEKRLKQIFSDELNSENSIFLKVKPSAIHQMALFLSGEVTRSCSIGIAGETASGKSTIAFDIIETVQNFANEYLIENVITRINTDDYYFDRSDMVKKAGSFAEFAKHYDLDVPEALELELMKRHIKTLLSGKQVYLPEYDMSGTAIRRDNVKLAHPSKIIISEGLFTLTDKVADAFDFKVYVDVSFQTQKERFYKRAVDRGLGDSADEVYQNASDKAKTYIHPKAMKEDINLSGEADRTAYKRFIANVLALIAEIHYNK